MRFLGISIANDLTTATRQHPRRPNEDDQENKPQSASDAKAASERMRTAASFATVATFNIGWPVAAVDNAHRILILWLHGFVLDSDDGAR